MGKYFLFVIAVVAVLLAGCSTMWNWSGGARSGASSSLVDYLYPDGQEPPDVEQTIPYLELPLRVGIGFVPGQAGYGTISEATKMQQVARLYDADVMALASYDQVAVSEENPAGLLYWTIVGAYLIKATSNEIQTFVDTARLLFRAPGAHTMSDRSTLVEAGEVVRKAKGESIAAAMEQMTGNLAVELDRFQERVKDDPSVAKTQWRPGSGGGAIGLWMLGLLALIGNRTRSS